MAFVDDHRVPVLRPKALKQARGADAVDRSEEVIPGSWRASFGEHLAETRRAERLPVSHHRLAQDLDAMRDKQQARVPALRVTKRAIIERCHDGLSRARRSYEQVARSPKLTLPHEAI